MRFLQLTLLVVVVAAWWSYLFGQGQTYVHFDVALVITFFAIAGVVILDHVNRERL